MDQVASALRSCLMTTDGGIALDLINRDYRELECENIPYQRFGYFTLEDFLRNVPRVRLYEKNGMTYAEAIPDRNTEHLAQLIKKQRKPRKKKAARMMTGRRPAIHLNQNKKNGFMTLPRSTVVKSVPVVKPPVLQPMQSAPPKVVAGPKKSISNIPESTTPRIYSIQPPAQPVSQPQSAQNVPRPQLNQAFTSNIQQRFHKALNVNVNLPNRPSPRLKSAPIQENPCQEPQLAPKSAPVQSNFNMNPLKQSLSAIGTVPRDQTTSRSLLTVTLNSENVARQVSIPPLIPNCSRLALPPLKIIRPLSERLKRPSLEDQKRVTCSPEVENNKWNVPSGHLTPPLESDDIRQHLKVLAQQLNLPAPEYKVVKNISKNGQMVVYSQVILGGSHKYSNFPIDASTQEEAEKIAAAGALEAIAKLYKADLQKKVTNNKETIKQRLLAVVSAQTYGVFMETIPVCYKDQYGEKLPDNWEDIIRCSLEFTLDKGVGDRIIVSKYDPEVEKLKVTSPLNNDAKPSVFTYNTLPQLVLPSDDLWAVYVTHVASVSEVWVRLLGNDFQDKFLTLSKELNQHYSTVTESVSEVDQLKYYAAKVDDEFYRVRVENCDSGSDVEIFLIDTGEYEQVEISKLYPLEQRFFSVPPQAIRVCLYGLEEIAVCETTIEIIEKLLVEVSIYMQVLNRAEDDFSRIVLGIFYDTEGEEDININERISEEIHDLMKLSKLDVLLSRNIKIFEVSVSHIAYNGDVYIHIKNDGLVILAAMLNNLFTSGFQDEEKLKKAQFSTGLPLDPSEVYAALSSDYNWVRVQVAFPNSTNSKMRMIDFGGLLDGDKSQLLNLNELSPAIASFPPQAILVELNHIPRDSFSHTMVTRLNELMPKGELLLCKVIQGPKGGKPPVVEFFKRMQPNNLLISINNTLELEPELRRGQDDGNNTLRTRRRVERSVSKTSEAEDVFFEVLKQPNIPPTGEYFQVHVTDSVASPSNFVVQPYEQIVELEMLMRSLQDVYKKYDGPMLNCDSLKESKVYAAMMHDGIWYRVCIHKILAVQLVAVYLVDFGNIEVIAVTQLQPLKPEFLELPCQAIKAALFGIQPVHLDWSPQTVLRFQELVRKKNFVSVVRDLGTDKLSYTNLLLHLDLIDVSATDVDVHIDKVLIEEKRAIPKAN